MLKWCRDKLKSLTSEKPEKVEPIGVFLTGGARTGTSHLIKAVYQAGTKSFKHTGDIGCPSTILAGPAGVAAVNIGRSTII